MNCGNRPHQLTESVNDIANLVTELTSSVNSLIGIANQHQENFMVLVTEIRDIRTDIREMQSQIRGYKPKTDEFWDFLKAWKTKIELKQKQRQ
ncbi:hypothetical protein [Nostoc sp.]|uniref:hypothetical protein n=1 Tax=Nostoc sp. TaxID=1180 RepID=UPI002FF8DD4A